MNQALTIALMLALVTGCSKGDEPGRLTVGYSALRISLPVFVAKERGLFDAHGIDVELRRYETAQPLVDEVMDGRVLAGGFAALPIALVAANRQDEDLHLALAMVEDDEHPVSYLLRRREGSSVNEIADLSGRRVGILPTLAYRRWLDAVLRHSSVDPSSVQIVALAPPQQAGALDSGGVDALFTSDPMATAILASGVGERFGPPAPVPAATGGPLVFGSFLIHSRLSREQPATARRLIAALDEAVTILHSDQDAARLAMTEYVREAERAYVSRYPNARYLTSDRFGPVELSRAVDSMVEFGVIEQTRDVSRWVLRAQEAR